MSTIVELSVHMDCPGCVNKIRKALQKLDGVDNVDIDMGMQKVTVTGCVDQKKVLKTVRKSGRKAELWPFPYNPDYHNFKQYYHNDQYQHDANPHTDYYRYQSETNPPTNYYMAKPADSSYNYYVHGYNGHDHGYYRQPPYSVFDEPTSTMFSDENAHACSIM